MRVAYLPGSVLIAAFTALVSRRDERWAKWLVWGVASLAVAGLSVSALRGDWDGYSLNGQERRRIGLMRLGVLHTLGTIVARIAHLLMGAQR